MAPDLHTNFAYATVATAPSPATSGTSLVVSAGDGAKFPAVPFNVTIWPIGTQPSTTNAEVARVTARATDTLTITRAQESSSARTVVVGDQIAATVTALTLTDAEKSFGGVSATSPLLARGSSGLNVEGMTTFSNADYTALATDRVVAQIGTMSALRTVTLPAANAVNAGTALTILDVSGTVAGANLIGVVRAGSDTINGGAGLFYIVVPYGVIVFISDGTSKWTTQGVLPVGFGGTGQTTALAAYDALVPTTTRGDITYRGATTSLRLAKGTSGQFLKIGANDPAWATPTPADLGAGTASIALVSSSASGGLGYAVGAGGTVTQGAGSGKATGVQLDTVAGQITMNNAALAADTTVSFTLTNSAIAAADMLLLQHAATGAVGSYLLNAVTSAGSASINVRNITAGSLGEAIVIQFCVFKSAVS